MGDYGAPDHVLIHGCQAVPAEAVRQALLHDWEVQVASAPTASLDDYVFTIHRKVKLGFLASGFVHPDVDATADETGHVVVSIAEGPRYRCGPVHVTGAPAGASDSIISALTRVHPPETFGVAAGQNDFRVGMELLDDQDHPDWSIGDYAGFDTVKVGYLHDRVRAALNGLGFFAAQFDSSVDVEENVAVLNVVIRDPGPRAVLRHVEVLGASINKPDEVIHYLGTRPGQTLGVDDVLRAQRTLWDSARFKSHSISATFTGSDHSAIDLRIRVEELPGIPSLGQPLTPLQQASVNCGRWLVDRCRAGDDVLLKIEAPRADPPYFVLAAIGRDGLFIQLQGPATRPATEPATGVRAYAVAITPHLAGLYTSQARCVNQSGHVLSGQVTATCVPEIQPDGSSQWKFNLGAGITSGKSGFKLHVVLAPVAMVNLVLSNQSSLHYTVKDGTLEVAVPGGQLRVDMATGHLLACSVERDGNRIGLTLGAALAGSEAEKFDKHAVGPNRYDPKAVAESFTRFWAGAFWDALGRFPQLGDLSSNIRPLAAAMRLLGPPAASIISGALVESTDDPDETFYIRALRRISRAVRLQRLC